MFTGNRKRVFQAPALRKKAVNYSLRQATQPDAPELRLLKPPGATSSTFQSATVAATSASLGAAGDSNTAGDLPPPKRRKFLLQSRKPVGGDAAASSAKPAVFTDVAAKPETAATLCAGSDNLPASGTAPRAEPAAASKLQSTASRAETASKPISEPNLPVLPTPDAKGELRARPVSSKLPAVRGLSTEPAGKERAQQTTPCFSAALISKQPAASLPQPQPVTGQTAIPVTPAHSTEQASSRSRRNLKAALAQASTCDSKPHHRVCRQGQPAADSTADAGKHEQALDEPRQPATGQASTEPRQAPGARLADGITCRAPAKTAAQTASGAAQLQAPAAAKSARPIAPRLIKPTTTGATLDEEPEQPAGTGCSAAKADAKQPQEHYPKQPAPLIPSASKASKASRAAQAIKQTPTGPDGPTVFVQRLPAVVSATLPSAADLKLDLAMPDATMVLARLPKKPPPAATCPSIASLSMVRALQQGLRPTPLQTSPCSLACRPTSLLSSLRAAIPDPQPSTLSCASKAAELLQQALRGAVDMTHVRMPKQIGARQPSAQAHSTLSSISGQRIHMSPVQPGSVAAGGASHGSHAPAVPATSAADDMQASANDAGVQRPMSVTKHDVLAQQQEFAEIWRSPEKQAEELGSALGMRCSKGLSATFLQQVFG